MYPSMHWGRHPPAQCMLVYTLRAHTPWADTLLPNACWDTPPGQTPPWAHPPGRHCSGQYASYWNAFLFVCICSGESKGVFPARIPRGPKFLLISSFFRNAGKNRDVQGMVPSLWEILDLLLFRDVFKYINSNIYTRSIYLNDKKYLDYTVGNPDERTFIIFVQQ